MNIKSGEFYNNKTRRYLYPCIVAYYGQELINRINSFCKLAVGIGDGNKVTQNNCLFILLDTSEKGLRTTLDMSRFENFLVWIRKQDFYETDYLKSESSHMIVIKIPEKYQKSVFKFLKGKYSEMYSSKDIFKCYRYANIPDKELEERVNNNIKRYITTLTNDLDNFELFIKELNEDFGTTITKKDILEASKNKTFELDYPPDMKEEVFNYKEK